VIKESITWGRDISHGRSAYRIIFRKSQRKRAFWRSGIINSNITVDIRGCGLEYTGTGRSPVADFLKYSGEPNITVS
jgi:hypothetical protein